MSRESQLPHRSLSLSLTTSSIRPLLTAEVRARTLTGRDQITDDGRHLVDGIPFGRPYLRRPNRPDLRIPAPQETPAITSGSPNFELGPQHTELPEHLPAPLKGLLSGLDLLNPEDREEAQQNLTVVSVLSNLFGLNGPMGPRPGPNTRDLGLTSRLTHGESHATQRDRHNQTINGSRKVQFQMPEALEEDLDSEEDDEDFDPGDDGLEEDMEEEDENDTDSDSHSASSSASGTSSSDSESDSEDSSSDSDGESDASSAPEVRSSKGKSLMLPSPLASLPSVAPGKGRRATQARNERRTRTNRLRHLQQSGKLPSTATLKDLAEYETGMPKEDPADSTAHQPHSNWTGKRKRIDDEDKETNVVPHDHRKEALTKAFGEGIPSTRVELGEFQAAEVLALASGQAQPAVEAQSEKNAQEKETPRKRLRPDTSAISRILARQAAVSAQLPLPRYK